MAGPGRYGRRIYRGQQGSPAAGGRKFSELQAAEDRRQMEQAAALATAEKARADAEHLRAEEAERANQEIKERKDSSEYWTAS